MISVLSNYCCCFIEIRFHCNPSSQFPRCWDDRREHLCPVSIVELGLMWSTSAKVPSELKASVLLLWNEMGCFSLLFFHNIYFTHMILYSRERFFLFVCFDNAVNVDQPGNGNGVTWLPHPANGSSNTTGFKLAVNLPAPLSTSF